MIELTLFFDDGSVEKIILTKEEKHKYVDGKYEIKRRLKNCIYTEIKIF